MGYPEQELLNQPLRSALRIAGTNASEVIAEAGETQCQAKDGRIIPVHYSSSLVHDNQDKTDKLVCVISDISAQKSVEERLRKNEKHLQHLAHHDYLTDLPNRLLFRDRLEQAMGMAGRSGKKVAVLVLDLDRFKKINDSLGHQMGDRLICAVAERFRDLLRKTDTVARFGGDEFAMIMPEFKTQKQLLTFVEKVLSSLQTPFNIENHLLYVSSSIGVSIYPDDGATEEILVTSADVAMYRAKEQGRNNYRFYTPEMNARAREFLALESALRQALEKQQLVLHYQPQVDLQSGRISGAEALLRWQHEKRGLVSPVDFIPIAEESGLIVPIGEWVLRTACLQSKALEQLGVAEVRMAVNISARQFQDPGFLDMVQRVVLETAINPHQLELELTESLLMDDSENAIAILKTLKSMGLQLAIDDFGTGFSSLSYLKMFPIDRLKIDRSFVRDVTTDPNDAAIAISVIDLAKNMNLEVIAEGIETEEHVDFLQGNDCHEGQGFLFSRPLPAEDFAGCFDAENQEAIRRLVLPRKAANQ